MTSVRAAPHRVPDSLTVHSMGGLGNQLFIYAAGLAAAEAIGVRLRVDVGQHAAREDRPCLLGDLGLPADYVDVGMSQGSTTLRRRLSRWRSLDGAVPEGCSFRESGFVFDPAVLRQVPGSCLFGYFQSWRYLETVADQMRGHLCRLAEAREERLSPLAERLDDSEAIAVHVRRGDYLRVGARDYHGVAGHRFYRAAIDTLRRMGYAGPVYLFSDDLVMARREFADLKFIEPHSLQPLEALDEMLLMSRAAALVTANSSFSWWAGWLGDRPNRPVIAPRPWFDDPAIDTRDLVPPHWLTLDRRVT